MRICVLLTPVEYGGGERQIVLLSKEFQKRGIGVILVNLAKSSAFEEALSRKEIPFITLTSRGLGFSPMLFHYFWHLLTILPIAIFSRRLREEIAKSDVIWARGFPANALLVALRKVLRFRRPKIIYSHHWEKRKMPSPLRWCNLKILEPFDAIVGVSRHTAETLRKIFPELSSKIIAIPNGIETSKFEIRKSKSEIREELGLPLNAVIAIYAARFTPPKNHRFLLEVLRAVPSERFRLLLLGEGSERESFLAKAREMQLEERIIHRGFVKPDEVPKYLLASDFCVFPSQGEGFSNAILEAMAAGLPVVMFKRIWSEEYGENVIPVETPEDFIAAVKKLVADPAEAAQRGSRCRQDVKQLDIGIIAQRYLEVFSQI